MGPFVAIVGAGPVGALAALELARNGVKVVLLEARNEVAWTSRAICISRRSLEILDRAGVGEAFTAKGLAWSRGKTFHRDRLVFRLELPHAPDDCHPPFINLPQCYTERFLIDAIDAQPLIDLRWGHRVTEVVDTGDGVSLKVAKSDGSYTMIADWLVAADGARSVVRGSLGLSMKGTSYEGRYLISDIEVEGASWPVERHVWFDAPANPGSTVILHVQPDRIWRVDMQLHDDEDAELALRDEQLLPRLQAQLDMMGVDAPWRLVWKSIYRAHSLSLDSYRHGRVLFAGDAAHLVPIFGVRGLNSGFDDAHNLTWKLAMVVHGDAPDALLDSYSVERRRATAENIANADKSTWFMSPPTAGFRRMRDATLLLAHDVDWARSLINPRQSSSHVYESSNIVVRDDGPNGIRPGAPIPNMARRDGHLHSALPPTGFSALLFEAGLSTEKFSEAERECHALGIATIRIGAEESVIGERFAANEFPLYLIRPDEHVAARLKPSDTRGIAECYRIAIGEDRPTVAPDPDCRIGSEVEQIYEALSRALDRSDPLTDTTTLERIALALASELGDSRRVRELIEQALNVPTSAAKKDVE